MSLKPRSTPRLFGGPLFRLKNNPIPARASIQMAKAILPAAIKISGMANNRHSRALSHSAINFLTANSAQRNMHANRFVNAMINYYFSPGNFSPHTKQIARAALNKARVHAPEHYEALKWAAIRKTPKIIYKSLV